jgi:hypothetical protein
VKGTRLRVVVLLLGLTWSACVLWTLSGIWALSGNPVLREVGGQEIRNPGGVRVGSAVFATTNRFTQTCEALRGQMQGVAGVAHEGYCTISERGICRRYVSQPFNQIASGQGSFTDAFSTLEVEIRDANDLLGSEGAVIVIRRIDQWRDWGREFHTGIRIPLRVDVDSGPFVTDREVALVRAVVPDAELILPGELLRPLMEPQVLEKARRALSGG